MAPSELQYVSAWPSALRDQIQAAVRYSGLGGFHQAMSYFVSPIFLFLKNIH